MHFQLPTLPKAVTANRIRFVENGHMTILLGGTCNDFTTKYVSKLSPKTNRRYISNMH